VSTSLDPAGLLPMSPGMPPDTGPRVLYIDADDDLAGLLDRVEESGLPASAVVGAFDPGHDREAQLLLRCPGAAVEDVFLHQAEEGFHRGVVAA